MTRAEALADLIERVGEDGPISAAKWLRHVSDAGVPYGDFADAYCGSLDAVARLEAPLRERGWGLSLYSPGHSDGEWVAVRTNERIRRDAEGRVAMARAWESTETRARLLAVLRALHWEASR